MGLARQIRRLRKAKEVPPARKRRKALLEPLEPRVLLDADLSFTMTGGANDLTLKLSQDGDDLQIVNTGHPDVILSSRTLADTSGVEIIGTDQDDVLKIDLDLYALLDFLPISFSGGEGNDTLVGPGTDNRWEITGADEGTLNQMVDFSDIEKLTGSDNSEDGFVFFAAGSISGMVSGGAGGSDGVIVEDPAEEGPFTVINPADSDPDAVALYDKTIIFAGMEPIVTPSSAGALIIRGSVNDDVLVLEDRDPLTPGEMQIRSASGDFFDAVTDSFLSTFSFASSAANLTILVGSGEDSLTLGAFDPSFGAAITYQGGAGLDTLAGANETNTWKITGENSGTLNTMIPFFGDE